MFSVLAYQLSTKFIEEQKVPTHIIVLAMSSNYVPNYKSKWNWLIKMLSDSFVIMLVDC